MYMFCTVHGWCMCGSLVFLPLYFETNEIKYLQKITIGTSESIRTEEEYKLQMELEEEDEAVSKGTWSGNWPDLSVTVYDQN